MLKKVSAASWSQSGRQLADAGRAGADGRAPFPARWWLRLEPRAGIRPLPAATRLAARGAHTWRGVGDEPRRSPARRDSFGCAGGPHTVVGAAATRRRAGVGEPRRRPLPQPRQTTSGPPEAAPPCARWLAAVRGWCPPARPPP